MIPPEVKQAAKIERDDMKKLKKLLLPSHRETIYSRFIDSTYGRYKREHRKCATCGVKWTYENKVNYGIAFDPNNKTYHEKCLPDKW